MWINLHSRWTLLANKVLTKKTNTYTKPIQTMEWQTTTATQHSASERFLSYSILTFIIRFEERDNFEAFATACCHYQRLRSCAKLSCKKIETNRNKTKNKHKKLIINLVCFVFCFDIFWGFFFIGSHDKQTMMFAFEFENMLRNASKLWH